MSVIESIFTRAFGRPTGVLGRLGGKIMAHANRPMAQRVVELLDVQPTDRLLEIGFGPGVAIELLSHSLSSGVAAGVDPSEEMLEQARARNAAGIAAGKVDLQLGSVDELPYRGDLFDKALAINSMQLWPDAGAGLREIRRVLRPEGRLILGFTRHSGQTREGLTELVEASGFTDARVVELEGDFVVVARNPGGKS